MDVSSDWKQDETAPTDLWNRYAGASNDDRGYIRQYEGSSNYYWHTKRGGFTIAGLRSSRETAMTAANEALEMPLEEFNAQVVARLKNELLDIERDLLRLQPDADVSPGYRIGFEAGQAYVKEKIMAVMP